MDDDDDLLRHVIGLAGGEPRCTEYTGTKALMMAVLEVGIRDYCGAAGLRCAEAEGWMRSNLRGPFSFAVVCEILGLEPSAVRQALVRLKKQSGFLPCRIPRPSAGKNRPTARIR